MSSRPYYRKRFTRYRGFRVPYRRTYGKKGYYNTPRYSRNLNVYGKYRGTKRVFARGRAPLQSRGWNFPMIGEKKFIDTVITAGRCDTTGDFYLLNGLQTGTQFNQRIGRKVVLMSWQMRGKICSDQALEFSNGNTVAQNARIIIFIDNQPNNTVPALTDVLTVASSNAFINPDYRDRFKVLADKLFPIGPCVIASGAPYYGGDQVFIVSDFQKMKVETIYNAGNAGTIGDINTGALYALFVGDQARPGGGVKIGTTIATVNLRIRFADP